jgi:hypothetical protein
VSRRTAGAVLVVVGGLIAATTAVWVWKSHEYEQAIPWVDGPIRDANLGRHTPRYVPPVPRGADECRSSDLRLSVEEPQPLNSVTTIYALTAHNVSQRTCALAGRPWIEVPPSRAPLRILSTGSLDPPPGFPRQGVRFGLAPGQIAYASLSNVRLCPVSRAEVTLAIQVGMNSSYRGLPMPVRTCTAEGGSLEIGPWAPPHPPEPAPLRWSIRASIEGVHDLEAGAILRYRVRLTNTSVKPFRFPFCPLHAAGLDGGDGTVAPLNCKSTGALSPRESAVFEMRLRVSPHFQQGEHRLGWRLTGETGESVAEAAASVRIRRR